MFRFLRVFLLLTASLGVLGGPAPAQETSMRIVEVVLSESGLVLGTADAPIAGSQAVERMARTGPMPSWKISARRGGDIIVEAVVALEPTPGYYVEIPLRGTFVDQTTGIRMLFLVHPGQARFEIIEVVSPHAASVIPTQDAVAKYPQVFKDFCVPGIEQVLVSEADGKTRLVFFENSQKQ